MEKTQLEWDISCDYPRGGWGCSAVGRERVTLRVCLYAEYLDWREMFIVRRKNCISEVMCRWANAPGIVERRIPTNDSKESKIKGKYMAGFCGFPHLKIEMWGQGRRISDPE